MDEFRTYLYTKEESDDKKENKCLLGMSNRREREILVL